MKEFNSSNNDDCKILQNLLFKSFQSCNINFLFGAGTSYPAITTLGNTETEIQNLRLNNDEKKANKELIKFLKRIYQVAIQSELTSEQETEIEETKNNYKRFIFWLNRILVNRKNEITDATANIFTTNYDLYIEYACEQIGNYFNYNDGFASKNNFYSKPILDVAEFNKKVSYCTNLYKHTTFLPNVNLVKLHGSLNWHVDNSTQNIILYDMQNIYKDICNISEASNNQEDVKNFINSIGLVSPTKDKFGKTVLERYYYNFLRYFANELEKENSFLFTVGFSFADEHICDLVKKILSVNPTLQLYICVFNDSDKDSNKKIFNQYNNVTLIYNAEDNFSFTDCIQKLEFYFKDLLIDG